MTDDENRIYKYVSKYPQCTRTDIRRGCSTNERSTSQATNFFVREGIMTRTEAMPPRYTITGITPWEKKLDTGRLVLS